VEFLPDSGHAVPRIRSDPAETTLQGEGGACSHTGEQFDVHPKLITSWKVQLDGGAADVFGPGGSDGTAQPEIDVKSLPRAESRRRRTIPKKRRRQLSAPLAGEQNACVRYRVW
jgi:transposase